VVSLTCGTVESCVPRPDARPRIAPNGFLLVEQIAKSHLRQPDLQSAADVPAAALLLQPA
jgi:hypothetical protein